MEGSLRHCVAHERTLVAHMKALSAVSVMHGNEQSTPSSLSSLPSLWVVKLGNEGIAILVCYYLTNVLYVFKVHYWICILID